jgi:DNA-directed RNA polymerase subunit RPC12/RpoP
MLDTATGEKMTVYLLQMALFEPPSESISRCVLTYYDGWALCSNCKKEWVESPRRLETYKYCPQCGAKIISAEEEADMAIAMLWPEGVER